MCDLDKFVDGRSINLSSMFYMDLDKEYFVYILHKDYMDKGEIRNYRNAGIYIYVGYSSRSEEYIGDVYIGKMREYLESDTSWEDRVIEDDADLKEWKEKSWQYTLYLTPKDGLWTDDEITYLRNMLYNLIIFAERYYVLNETEPAHVDLSKVNKRELNNVLIRMGKHLKQQKGAFYFYELDPCIDKKV